MQALPVPKTATLIDRLNKLALPSLYYAQLDQISDRTREMRQIRAEIEQLFKVDAAAAWETLGAWYALAGDAKCMTEAFKNSFRLGGTETAHINFMVNTFNVGMFSATHDACVDFDKASGDGSNHFAPACTIALCCGALTLSERFAHKASAMKKDLDAKVLNDLAGAVELLRAAGVSDADVARQLDVAGTVLRRHHMRPRVNPRVTDAAGFFRGVTYAVHVPVSSAEAFEMNMELASAEEDAGIQRNVAFDVVFETAQ
jgi:hypothetical protein